MTITAEDVYFRHQIVATQDRVADTGLGFHENSHFVVFDRRGEAAGVVGLGVYPNVGIMFGYACFTVDGVQHNVRLSRAFAGDRWTTRVGPLAYDLRKPLEEYELVLEPNASGISFRLLFTATALAGEVDNSHRPDQVQFNQFGSMTGRLEVGGRAFAL
ncbi:MAG: hypothetical protein IT304_07335, partial [Dehalococcoidia bacterium]|nr:hypothetical protein [Dehalococcoidia bacterium]